MKQASTLSTQENSDISETLTLGKLFFDRSKEFQNSIFISHIKNQSIFSYTWKAFSEKVISAINLLKAHNIKRGDRVVFISDNSPELICFILATLSIGAICCPISTKSSVKQIEFLLNYFDPELIMVSEDQFTNCKNIFKLIPNSYQVTIINPEILYKDSNFINSFDLTDSLNNLSGNDLAYIMLSSGTTGNQKGVILTHNNIISNQIQIKKTWPYITSNDIFLSHLPLYHSYGGLSELYQVIYNGCQYHLCNKSDIPTLMNNMNLIKPTVFHTIPRIWEKLFKYCKENNITTPNQLRRVLNKELKLGFSAGAPLDKKIVGFFNDIQFPIYQGYGLTETSPTIAVATPDDFINDNMAQIVPNIDLKISEDNEILVKGPNVTQGYFKDSSNKENYFINGYLKTGDLGMVPQTGYLRLIGRNNDIISLSTGEKVFPYLIETALNEHPLIDYSVLIGNNKPFLSAVIIINKDKYISSTYNTYDSLTEDLLIKEEYILYNNIQEHIDKINNSFAKHEQIKKFILSLKPLNLEEYTPTQKLKRKLIETNWKTLIEKLYT